MNWKNKILKLIEQETNSSLKEELEILTKEIDDLKTIVIKFTKRKENLDAILNQQRCGFNCEGLGYKCENKEPV